MPLKPYECDESIKNKETLYNYTGWVIAIQYWSQVSLISFSGQSIPLLFGRVAQFGYEFNVGVPEKNVIIPILTAVLSLLMVNTLRFHGLKEINFQERKPFWFLVVLFVLLIHPSTAIFVFAMLYFIF